MEHLAVNIDHYKKVLSAKAQENQNQKGYHPVYGLFDIAEGIKHPLIGKKVIQNSEYYLISCEYEEKELKSHLNSDEENQSFFIDLDINDQINFQDTHNVKGVAEYVNENVFKVKANGIICTVQEIPSETFTVKKVFLSYPKSDTDGYGYYLQALIENKEGSSKTIAFQNIDCSSEYVLDSIEQTQEKFTFTNY